VLTANSQAKSSEVKDLRREMSDLKEALADVLLESRLLKNSMLADGGEHE
jgi:transposase